MNSDRRILFLLLLFLLVCSLVAIAQEQITLTTFYPAPFGEYQSVRLVPTTGVTAGAACTQPGLMQYDDTTDKFLACAGSPSTWIIVGESGSSYWTQTGSNLYTTDLSSNVGVGTATPQRKLDVAGGTGTYQLGVGITGANPYQVAVGVLADNVPTVQATQSGITNDVNLALNPLGGRVGIGTAAPQAKVDIAATGDGAQLLRLSTSQPWVFQETGVANPYLDLKSTADAKPFIITSPNGNRAGWFHVSNTAANNRVFLVPDGGRVSIGGGTPFNTLSVNGSIKATSYPDFKFGIAGGATGTGGATFWAHTFDVTTGCTGVGNAIAIPQWATNTGGSEELQQLGVVVDSVSLNTPSSGSIRINYEVKARWSGNDRVMDVRFVWIAICS